MGSSDYWVHREVDRVEVFEIAEDEQLIGCELDEIDINEDIPVYFIGVTWIKIKLTD